jgi:tetratricopeptide (TPR) repeat protein
MRFVIVTRTGAAIRIGGLVVLLFAWILPAAARPVGYFRHLHPITRVGHGGHSWIDARERSAFGYNDIIRTMGRGETMLVFNNGNMLTLKPHTTIQIMPPRSAESPLVIRIFGALSGLVGRSNGQLQIVSAAGNAAARGTEFMVDLPTDDSMRVTVAEGAVDFSNPFGAVTVEAGKQSTARVGSAPTPPTAVDVSGLIQWAADITGLPVEFETPFITPDPAAAARLVAQRTGPARAEPQAAPGHYQLGAALYDAGEYAAAAGEFQTALQLAPGTISYLVALGQARRGMGDAPGAIDVLQQALATAPDDPLVRSALALAYLSQVYRAPATRGPATTRQAAAGASTAAAPHVATIALDRPTAGSPAAPSGTVQAVITASERQEAARQILAPVQAQPLPEAILALVELHAGHAGRAVELCHDALHQQPDLYQAQALLALALLTENHVTEAVQAARRAEQLQPASAQVEGILSMALFFSGATKAATQAAGRAVKINPTSPFALLTMGRAYLAQHRLDDALESLQQAQALAPDLPVISTELGTAYLRLDRPQRAQKAFTHALALDPTSATARAGLGAALQQQGKTAEARAAYDRALAQEPHNATALANLALLLIEQGQLKEARARLEEAVKVDPQFGIYYTRLSEVSLYQQDLIGAQESARRGVELLPDSAIAHYQLGRVYLEQDRNVQAEQEFRQAVTIDPRFTPGRYALGFARERTETGFSPVPSVSSGSINVGSPRGALDIRNLQSPGANDRILAEVDDPTVIRIASRSFGDTQIDSAVGNAGTHDVQVSHLSDTNDRRKVLGITAEDDNTDGPRDNSDRSLQRVSVSYGGKYNDNRSRFFVSAEDERQELGLNSLAFGAPDTIGRSRLRFPRALAGYSLHGRRHRTSMLFQYLQPTSKDTGAADGHIDNTDFGSLDFEFRHDIEFGARNLFTAGFATGHRKATTNIDQTMPFLPTVLQRTKIGSSLAYVRDEFRPTSRTRFIAEMRAQRLAFDSHFVLSFPPDFPFPGFQIPPFILDRNATTSKALPTLVMDYQPNAWSRLRFRYRSLLGTLEDFELLSPDDDFLFSTDSPRLITFTPLTNGFGRGSSSEVEYSLVTTKGASLRLGLFEERLSNAQEPSDSGIGALVPEARTRGARINIEGLLNRHTAMYSDLNLTSAKDLQLNQYISNVPRVFAEVGVHYLHDRGWFVQPSAAYVSSQYTARDFATRSGGIRFGGFGLFNLRFGKKMGLKSTIFAEIDNIFDKSYLLLEAVQPGRRVQAGWTVRF